MRKTKIGSHIAVNNGVPGGQYKISVAPTTVIAEKGKRAKPKLCLKQQIVSIVRCKDPHLF